MPDTTNWDKEPENLDDSQLSTRFNEECGNLILMLSQLYGREMHDTEFWLVWDNTQDAFKALTETLAEDQKRTTK